MFKFIDPDALETFESPKLPGVKFSIRPIPRGKWTALRNASLLILERTRRRVNAELFASKIDPEERVETISIAKIRENLDPVATLELANVNEEIVRWGLVKIEGAELAEGVPFELSHVDLELEGRKVRLLDERTMKILSSQRDVILEVSNRLWAANELGATEKKS